MKFNRYLIYLTQFITLSVPTFALQVLQEVKPEEPAISEGLAGTILTIFIVGILSLMFIILFVWILVKIFKKLSDHQRKKQDFLYEMFEKDVQQANFNRDKDMKYRNWKMMWIFFKRHPIYVNTERGLEIVGEYNGETYKKENFYLISIVNKLSMFKNLEQIIIVPIQIQNIVSKVVVNGKKVIILNAEGIDMVGNTDFYFQPLKKHPSDDKKFVDFADMIHKDYFEKTIYRDIIKENLQQYRDGIIHSVETNPYTQFNRRK